MSSSVCSQTEAKYHWEDVIGVLQAINAADHALEGMHGKWIIRDKYKDYRGEQCSVCGFVANRDYIQDVWRFCPYCGARMDGEGNA